MTLFNLVITSPWTLPAFVVIFFALLVMSLVRGWLRVGPTVDSLLKIQSERIKDAIKRGDDFQAAYQAEVKLNEIQGEQIKKLLIVGDTVTSLLNKLPDPQKGGSVEP